MSFNLGVKVRFRFTGETGIVVALLEGGMVLVRLDTDPDLDIPTYPEDLQPASEKPALPPNPYAPKKAPPTQAAPPPRRVIRAEQPVAQPQGLQMCFEPMPGRDGTVARFKAWLLNDTRFDFLADIGMYIGDEALFHVEDFSPAGSAMELGELLADDLNDHPEIDALVQRMTTAGTDDPIERIIKVKPKQFFNRIQYVPILQMPVHHFVLFDRFESKTDDSGPANDLKTYTKQHVKTSSAKGPVDNSKPYPIFDVHDFATFEPEIDLHIEKLVTNWQKLSNADILRTQMHRCRAFIDKAIRLGLSNVFIIHGLGEGKLRGEIAEMLRIHPHVRKFENNFHPKYGFGATEVWF
ncbi:MAG: Smr/MutS family protein [Saprospiraceae bacterium]|nr:Smr/MutS family protein [Saprospiraceae bacterium]